MVGDPQTKRLLWFVFTGSRGGLNRLKIIKILRENQMNANQIANNLGLDYKAIQHHLRVLEKNNLIGKSGEKYAVMYFIAPLLEVNIEIFDEIAEKLDKSK